MRGYRLMERSLDALVLQDLPEAPPGAGEVRVELRAASLNYRDLALARGQYQAQLPLPVVPLSDGAGVVVAVGAGVERWRVGDRVTSHYTTAWQDGRFDLAYHASKLGGPRDGVLREFVTLPQDAWVATPRHLTDLEAATLPIAALTAWSSLRDLALPAGATVLVQGTGSVALFALQFARAAGLRVLATTTRREKAPRLASLGADEVLLADEPGWGARAFDCAGGGVDGVVDVGGSATLPESLAALRADGAVAVVGFLGGFGPVADPTLAMLAKRARLFGQSVGSRAAFVEMNRAIERHAIRPVIDRVFGFGEARAAYEHLAAGRAVGKVVIGL